MERKSPAENPMPHPCPSPDISRSIEELLFARYRALTPAAKLSLRLACRQYGPALVRQVFGFTGDGDG